MTETASSRGRYELLDSDSARLPEGMHRIAYDADTQIYTFRDDADGSFWESSPGNRHGQLHRQGSTPPPSPPISATARESDLRYFAPWVLIVVVVLMSVFWFVNRPAGAGVVCPRGMEGWRVAEGETCWGIAEGRGVGLEELSGADGGADGGVGLDCDRYRPGDWVCVPFGSAGE